MAQLIIAAAGAAIGGMMVPGVIAAGITGAQAGWIVGSLVGSAFAPAQKVQGPRLSDLSVSSSAYGTPIPYVQGSPRLAGQIIYASTKREIATTTRQGGKGGGKQKVTTYTYEVDLLILLTDNVMRDVSRIWSNGKLIWNKSTTADAATLAASDATSAWSRIAVYSGESTQLPDPTYEEAVGTANAPAYRGRGTVFIQGLQLGSSGQIPNLTFEVDVSQSQLSASNTGLLNNAEADYGGISLLSTIGPNLVYIGGASRNASQHRFGTGALQVTASGGYASASPVVLAKVGKAWRFEGWFKGTNTFGQLFNLRSTSSSRKLSISSNGPGAGWSYNIASLLGSGGGALFGAVTPVPANGSWYHFAVQKYASSYIYFFCNGTVIGAVGTAAGEHFTDSDLDIVEVGGSSGVAGYFDSLLFRNFTGPTETALLYNPGNGFSTPYTVPGQAFW